MFLNFVVFIVSAFYLIDVFLYFFVVIDSVFSFRDAWLPFTLDLIFLFFCSVHVGPRVAEERLGPKETGLIVTVL